jgi:hypothetical protein
LRRCQVEGDERSRLHEIVDRLPEQELSLACQLLELLTHGSAALRAGRPGGTSATDEDDDDEDEAAAPATSPETIAKLAQLTDEELLRMDELLDSDREGAKQFWRQRFGEELADDELIEDDRP